MFDRSLRIPILSLACLALTIVFGFCAFLGWEAGWNLAYASGFMSIFLATAYRVSVAISKRRNR